MMKAACLMLMASATTSAFAQKMNIEHKGDTTIIKVENPTKYLLLPIQEEKDEAQVLLDTGSKDDTWMDVAWLRMVLITMCLSLWARVRLLQSRFLV